MAAHPRGDFRLTSAPMGRVPTRLWRPVGDREGSRRVTASDHAPTAHRPLHAHSAPPPASRPGRRAAYRPARPRPPPSRAAADRRDAAGPPRSRADAPATILVTLVGGTGLRPSAAATLRTDGSQRRPAAPRPMSPRRRHPDEPPPPSRVRDRRRRSAARTAHTGRPGAAGCRDRFRPASRAAGRSRREPRRRCEPASAQG